MVSRPPILLSENTHYFNWYIELFDSPIFMGVFFSFLIQLTANLPIGTKSDLREDPRTKRDRVRIVRPEEGFEICKRIKAHMFQECSSKTLKGVDEIFQEAARYFLYHSSPSKKSKSKGKNKGCVML